MASNLSKTIGFLLLKKQFSLAIAESCTGGLVAAAITDTPGSSAYFTGGIIAYDNEVKISLLGVSARLISKKGAVSAECASAMAQGVRRKLKTDWGLSVTGIAGPTGGSAKKPVGLVYTGVASAGKISVQKFLFSGSRSSVRKQAVRQALVLLKKELLLKPRS